MRRLLFSFSTPLLIILVCILSNCDNQQGPLDNQQDLLHEYLSFNDMVCDGLFGKSLQGNYFLHDWFLNDDILSLDFRFNNTCGSAYQNSVSIMQDTISICLTDTARVHARCVCEHQCQFQFRVEGLDDIRLLMEIKFYAQDNYISCVDTLLQW